MTHNYKQYTSRLSNLNKNQLTQVRTFVNARYSQTIISILAMWYNTDDKCTVFLEDEYAVVRCWPLDEEPFWISFGWITKDRSLRSFLDFLKENKVEQLKYCPDFFVLSLVNMLNKNNTLIIGKSEKSYSDYIYNIDQIKMKEGSLFKDFRWEIRNFEHIYEKDFLIKNSTEIDNGLHSDLKHLHDIWMYQGSEGTDNNDAELAAIESFFKLQESGIFGKIFVTRLFIKSKLVGLSISEQINKTYVLSHFQKSNLNISHVNKFLFDAHIEYLASKGFKYLNYQNDLGLEGLRLFKKKLRPSSVSAALDVSLN